MWGEALGASAVELFPEARAVLILHPHLPHAHLGAKSAEAQAEYILKLSVVRETDSFGDTWPRSLFPKYKKVSWVPF